MCSELYFIVVSQLNNSSSDVLYIFHCITALIDDIAVYKDTKQRGFLYLYDGRVSNYTNDGIPWKKTRMSVKLIVFNKTKGIYKLKNHKNDQVTTRYFCSLNVSLLALLTVVLARAMQ